MVISPNIRVYGDLSYRGACATEDSECQTIINQCKKRYPDLMIVHIKNEGKRTKAQMDEAKAMGFIKGASDYMLVGNPVGYMEVKRKNYSHKLSKEQEVFLIEAEKRGAFTGMVLGWEAALDFIEDWHKLQNNS